MQRKLTFQVEDGQYLPPEKSEMFWTRQVAELRRNKNTESTIEALRELWDTSGGAFQGYRLLDYDTTIVVYFSDWEDCNVLPVSGEVHFTYVTDSRTWEITHTHFRSDGAFIDPKPDVKRKLISMGTAYITKYRTPA